MTFDTKIIEIAFEMAKIAQLGCPWAFFFLGWTLWASDVQFESKNGFPTPKNMTLDTHIMALALKMAEIA